MDYVPTEHPSLTTKQECFDQCSMDPQCVSFDVKPNTVTGTVLVTNIKSMLLHLPSLHSNVRLTTFHENYTLLGKMCSCLLLCYMLIGGTASSQCHAWPCFAAVAMSLGPMNPSGLLFRLFLAYAMSSKMMLAFVPASPIARP